MLAFRPMERENLTRSFAFSSKLESLIRWGTKNSLWPMPYGTACCGVEMTSALGPKYELARFGAEAMRYSPQDSDVLIVAGTITRKLAPYLVDTYERMIDPKYVIALGACAGSGGLYPTESVIQGIGQLIPVDVFVPGCPPSPESVLDSVLLLKKMIEDQTPRPWKENWQAPEKYRMLQPELNHWEYEL